MAIVKKVSYSGSPTTNDLSGQLRFEQGNNRLVLFDGTVNRMILGQLPDGNVNIIFTKEGVDAFDVFS